jgi:diaminopimelate decarboxylase
MDHFEYRNNELFCEQVPAAKIAAEVGTPVFVYSAATLLDRYREIASAFAALKPTICYSIKCCGNLHILRLLANEGCGFDVTSHGEVFRALRAGGQGRKIIFAGVGKSDEEIAAGISANIAAFNCESEEEIENIDRIAGQLGKTAIGALRVNPDVDPKTHAKINTGKKETKFGVDIDRAERVFEQYRALKHFRLAGVHIHIGSSVLEIPPYVEAVKKMIELIDRLTARGHKIEWFDVGGGFGASYTSPDQAKPVTEHAKVLVPLLQNKPYHIAFEPGRYIAANAGILLTRVQYRKTSGAKQFVIVDAAMNDLIRPTLYEGYHHIWPVKIRDIDLAGARTADVGPADAKRVDVVGPVCETGDYLALDRLLPPTRRGDLLSIFTAGAYGFAMSSNYNNRPRAAEVLVQGASHRIISRRETLEDLVAREEESDDTH